MTRKSSLPQAAINKKAEAIASTLALGMSHHNQGHLSLAEGCYRQVLTLDSNNVDALHMLGVVHLQTNRADEAIRLMKRATRKNPAEPSILVNLGAAYRKAGQNEDARAAYEAAIKLKPDLFEAHFNLAKVLYELHEMSASIEAAKKCIALNPNQADAYLNMGNAYKFKRDEDNALAAYHEALRLAPHLAIAYGNIGAVMVDRCRFEEAHDWVSKAIAADPLSGELKFKRSLIGLRLGRLQTGWEDYEGRFFAEKERVARYPTPPSYWTGGDISGKTILIWTEQGLGDEIIFSGMIPDLLSRAGGCIIECSPRMVPVFQRSFPQAKVVRYRVQGERATPAGQFDTQISIVSLGKYLRRDFASFPAHAGYLKADEQRVGELRARYKALAPGNLVVGVSWRSKNDSIGPQKSANLENWSDVLTVKGVTFVNLQYGDCAADLEAVKKNVGVEVHHDPEVDALKNMDNFFAQVAAMDLVITTSNTTVHVAGSMGVPAWLLLTRGASSLWYWFVDRTESPWYPSVRIFRATEDSKPGASDWWIQPVRAAGKALEARAAESGGDSGSV